MCQSYKVYRAVRNGIEPNNAGSRKIVAGGIRMVPAPGGVAFVRDEPPSKGVESYTGGGLTDAPNESKNRQRRNRMEERKDVGTREINHEKVEASVALMTSLGHRMGLFDAMAGLAPSTSAQIASAADRNER